MAHWFMTCLGNAVNLDLARQLFVKQGRDDLFRVAADFVISKDTGDTVTHTLATGFASEAEADTYLRAILFEGLRDATTPATIRQSGQARSVPVSP